ncbi:hypothetical protein ANCDUO_20811, partial [Ancylostoma duodenale]
AFELPKQFDNFTALADRFRHYKDEHFGYITTVFICAYLYKQTFAIPGSFFLVSSALLRRRWTVN